MAADQGDRRQRREEEGVKTKDGLLRIIPTSKDLRIEGEEKKKREPETEPRWESSQGLF